jgi:hypothetical protein
MSAQARRDGLLIENLGDEVVVYDLKRDRAHRLNRTTALVWSYCDGQRTVPQMAAELQRELDPAVSEDLVWLTLDRLESCCLLEGFQLRSPEQTRMSRRRVVRNVGLVGALSLLLPTVTTLVVPTPAQAQSCSSDQTCSDDCCVTCVP